ncbi:4-oxalocrotonate tautomerase [Heyndrickxia oleronia]|uniref:4-oxalocrotonate tautomerase n=1 Tax=Heyndrickxia oleronia TaxID=38875 RepID=A0A8E2I9B6_9BACI|nr:4-oxalocrotonate tautomerase [Heyndrickxia oleronia]NYV65126.1 4-oxalocrotonate tautomerase [Bacillus sp. Gen3]MCM3452419.1 4-oxalocrotonate tautomerase [Heyndrickxia oleronia]MEC1377077.1 4-oxalocrotonate tautomerase [Heyndrickxia oleronia]OOP69156.1 4-oxalocrotonate tautomerase [Heyndrickxia oleronia]QQZ05774.1 4-oxalocrotonate tautomerase [Heyndrickxia oleronia]
MPIIQVQIIKGRSKDKINSLIEDITLATVKNLSVNAEQVRVLVNEIPDTHWGVGGTTKAELDRKKTEPFIRNN